MDAFELHYEEVRSYLQTCLEGLGVEFDSNSSSAKLQEAAFVNSFHLIALTNSVIETRRARIHGHDINAEHAAIRREWLVFLWSQHLEKSAWHTLVNVEIPGAELSNDEIAKLFEDQLVDPFDFMDEESERAKRIDLLIHTLRDLGYQMDDSDVLAVRILYALKRMDPTASIDSYWRSVLSIHAHDPNHAGWDRVRERLEQPA